MSPSSVQVMLVTHTPHSTPSIRSLKKAMQTYARQGGTSSLFICDDGLRILSPELRDERLAFYATHNIGWVARPPHDPSGSGFVRMGRFKKASNMNYALRISLRLEKRLEELMEKEREKKEAAGSGTPQQQQQGQQGSGTPGSTYNRFTTQAGSNSNSQTNSSTGGDDDDNQSLEDKALALAVEDEFQATNGRWRPWAGNGKSIRMGEIVLIVDSDTQVPEVRSWGSWRRNSLTVL